ncbi:MAG TPA: metallophosphoesterase family protein [Bacteroidia bacterium]|jgi:putative phosphoesterase|nr:metallophosphoesterase family protein [Bacteroidia bacterium]
MTRIAIISDVHSNCFALEAVLADMKQEGIDKLILLGDLFGYYPWALETYALLDSFRKDSWFIKGNHDQLVLETEPPVPTPVYWEAAQQNRTALMTEKPEALTWLKALQTEIRIKVGGLHIKGVHGSPDDQLKGRIYPDTPGMEHLFSAETEILLTGHTHYPLFKSFHAGKQILFNPGSVGQSRDGNPMPSWGILTVETGLLEHRRSSYNQFKAMELLTRINWNKRAILALNKTEKGKLKE